MRVALVHDYLVQDGGAERVLLALHEIFPEAPIFTLFHHPDRLHPGFKGADIRASKLNGLPFSQHHYQWFLPFMAEAIESFDLTGFDLVISSSSSFAKGVIAAPGSRHICYCHTPTRFLWQERLGYVNDLPAPKILKKFLPHYLHQLRQWDRLAADRPDTLVTNSRTSQARIRRYYQRDAEVIQPPVDVEQIPLGTGPGKYWLAGGRFVGYKRFDLVVQALAKLDFPLKIFGQGPEEKRLRRLAGPKTEFLGRIDDATKYRLFGEAIAFLYPQVEDWGIAAVEAMAAGKPVIALGQGGATETVVDGVTGKFFEIQCWEDIADAVLKFSPDQYDPVRIREHARQFSKEKFQEKIRRLINVT